MIEEAFRASPALRHRREWAGWTRAIAPGADGKRHAFVFFHPDYHRRPRHLTGSADLASQEALGGKRSRARCLAPYRRRGISPRPEDAPSLKKRYAMVTIRDNGMRVQNNKTGAIRRCIACFLTSPKFSRRISGLSNLSTARPHKCSRFSWASGDNFDRNCSTAGLMRLTAQGFKCRTRPAWRDTFFASAKKVSKESSPQRPALRAALRRSRAWVSLRSSADLQGVGVFLRIVVEQVQFAVPPFPLAAPSIAVRRGK